MAKIGNLWFDLGINDLTEKDIKKITKGIEQKLKETGVDLGVNTDSMVSQIQESLSKRKFKVDIVVDKANVSKVVQEALAKAGYNPNVTPSDVRASRKIAIDNEESRRAERHAKAIEVSNLVQEKYRKNIEKTELAIKKSKKSLDEYNSSFGGLTKNMRTQFNLAVQLRNQLADLFSLYSIEAFIKSVAEVGGEFQKQEVALQTIFKDIQKADVIFERIKNLSVESPFEFKDLASYTKQLAAFSVPYEEIYDTTKRLADISAGVGVDMSRIILAFGQVRSAEFLKGTELRQFTEAGIPLLDKLSDKFTELSGDVVSVGDVLDKISKREVSFQMVKDVLWELTNEGGQFYNMQAKLADILAGKLSNLLDAYNIMISDIAESNNSTLGTGIDLLAKIMKNWESIAKLLKVVVASYTAYKAATLISVAVNKLHANSLKSLNLSYLIKQFSILTTAIRTQTNVVKALSLTFRSIAWPLAAITAVGFAIDAFSKKSKTAQEVSDDLTKSLADLENGFDSIDANNKLIDEYEKLSKKQNKTAEETKRLTALNKQLSSSFKGAEESVDEYGRALSMNIGKMREMSEQQKKNLKGGLEVELKEAQHKLKEVGISLKQHVKSLELLEKGRGKSKTIGLWDREDLINDQKLIISELQNEYNALEQSINHTQESISALSTPVKDSNTELAEWVKIVQKARETKPYIPEANEKTGYFDYIKNLNEEIDGYTDNLNLINKDNKNAAAHYESLNSKLLATRKLLKDIGGEESKTDKELNNDPVAKKYEDRIELMKEAMKTYEEYEKLFGADVALGKVKEDPRFSAIDFDPKKYKENLQTMLKELGKVMGGNEKRINVFRKIGEELFNIDKTQLEKEVKSSMESIEEWINRYSSKWDLFKSFMDKGLTKEVSMQLAFGGNIEYENFAEHIKDEILDSIEKAKIDISFEKLINMNPYEIEKKFGKVIGSKLSKLVSEYNNQSKELLAINLDYASDTLAKYLSTEEKIIKIKEDANKKIKALEEQRGAISPATLDIRKEEINKTAEEEIAAVKFEAFKKTAEWGKAFGNLEDLSLKSLNSIISALTRFRDSIKHNLSIEDLKELNDIIDKAYENATKRNPFKTISEGFKDLKSAKDSDSVKKAWGNIGEGISGVNDIINDVIQSLGTMFDALGNESASDVMDLISGLGNGLTGVAKAASSFATGDILGGIVNSVTSITGIITTIAQFHDKKLDRAIKKSELEVSKLKNAYKRLSNTIERQLGGVIESQSKEMLKNLESQRIEIEKQMALEDEKKKTDQSKMEDYRDQLSEIGDQIKYFYEDLAKEQYGVDLKSWASDLSSAIVDAFANGEDAAVAFNNTVSNILQDIVKEAVNLQFIQPAMDSLRDYLFGSKGIFTDNSELGTAISDKEALGLTQQINSLSSTLGLAEDFLNKVNEATGGLLESTEKSNSSLTGDIKENITEETASLLASYLNAIRADVSVNRKAISNIESVHLPTISVVAQAQLQQLNAIAENTRQNAEYARTIRDAISSVITQSNNGKAIRIK